MREISDNELISNADQSVLSQTSSHSPDLMLPVENLHLSDLNNSSIDVVNDNIVPDIQISNSDLVLALSRRHNLSDAAITDFLSLLNILNISDVPQNIREIYSNTPSAKSYYFCQCFSYKTTAFFCEACNKKAENFYYCPDFLTKIYNIASTSFNAGTSLRCTLYTDGVSPFKSSKYSIWPVYLVINNLPP